MSYGVSGVDLVVVADRLHRSTDPMLLAFADHWDVLGEGTRAQLVDLPPIRGPWRFTEDEVAPEDPPSPSPTESRFGPGWTYEW